MNDIEITWVDANSVICKVIYNLNMPHKNIKTHLDNIADSEFFTDLKTRYSVMVVGCVRDPSDTNIVNNYITMHDDGKTDVSSSGNVQVELKDDKKIFFVETDASTDDIQKTVEKFKNAMKVVEPK